MSKASKAGDGSSRRGRPAAPRPRRLNPRALIVLAGVMAVALVAFFGAKLMRGNKGRDTFLVEARNAFDEEKYDYAVKYVNSYLAGNPDSVPGLELKGKILGKSIRDMDGLREAIRVQEQILARVQPKDPEHAAAQKQLITLNLMAPPSFTGHAAEVAARKYLKECLRGPNDPDSADPDENAADVGPKPDAPNAEAVAEARRLLARALFNVSTLGGAAHQTRARDAQGRPIAIGALDEAIFHYEIAEALRPGDIASGINLARLYSDKNPAKAQAFLENLKAKNPSSVAARLALFRFFHGQPNGSGIAAANKELDDVLKIAPGDVEAQLLAAERSIQNGDTTGAREHLKKIDPVPKNDLRIKLVEGMIDFREQQPDKGIDSWRSGLIQTGGSDAQLTWRLAQVLISLGRLAEAKPLMNRFRGLTSGGDSSLPEYKASGTPEYRLLAGMEQLKLGNILGRGGPDSARKLAVDKTEEEKGAIALLEEIRSKIPRDKATLLLVTLGEAYMASNKMDAPAQAAECFRAACDMVGSGSQPFLALARLQLSQNKPGEAVTTIENGLRQSPDDSTLLGYLAQIFLRRELAKPKDAQDWPAFDAQLRAIEARDAKGGMATELAMVRADYLAIVGRLDEALERINVAVKDSPHSVAAWMAKASALTKLERLDDALAALDQASKAAGENAQFRAAKARLLNALGQPNLAYETLAKGLDVVPPDQRASLWASLGEFHQSRADFPSARRAFEEWSLLQPKSAEPRLALLRLAVAVGDVPAMIAQADSVEKVVGAKNVMAKVAWVEVQLKVKPITAGDKTPEEKDRLAKIAAKIEEIKADAPRQPSGFLLDGALKERTGQMADAIKAYRAALELGAGNAALKPLVLLLTREKRYDEVEKLRQDPAVASFPADLDQLASALAQRMGDVNQAEQMVQRMVQGDPQGLDAAVWKARILKENGKEREAEDTLEAMRRQRPDDPNAWVKLMMFQLAVQKPDKAKATFERMRAQIKPEGNELLWAACYRALDMPKEAAAAFQAALDRRPDDLKALQAAVEFYESTGRGDLAERSIRHMLAIRPNYDWARRRLAMTLSARPNDPAAWSEAMHLVGETPKGPESPDDRLLRATVLSRSGDQKHRDEAIAILENLAVELPNMTRLHEVIAKGLVAVGQKQKARAYAARAASADGALDALAFYVALLIDEKDVAEGEKQLAALEKQTGDPNSITMVELRARLLHAKGDDPGAALAVRRGFEARNPKGDALDFGTKLFRILIVLGLHDDAEKFGAELAKLGPKGQIALGEYLGGRGKHEEASRLFAEASRANPAVAADAARSTIRLASEDARPAGWLNQADGLLSLALKSQPDLDGLLQTQAMLRHMQGKYDEEIKTYQDILAKDPNQFMILNNWAWTLSEEMKKPEDGLKKIDEAIAKVGRQSHLVDTRGVILLRLGKTDEAMKELQIAATSLPTGPILFHMARACKKAGKADDFEKYRELARKAGLKLEQLQASEQDEAREMLALAPAKP